jgi:hypothetical protein
VPPPVADILFAAPLVAGLPTAFCWLICTQKPWSADCRTVALPSSPVDADAPWFIVWLELSSTEFDWVASTVVPPLSSSACWANACGVSAGTAEVVAITEIAAISAASVVVVFRDNIVGVDKGIIYLRFGAK